MPAATTEPVSDIIDEHRRYLRDRARLRAYERALAEVVQRGDVVVDLASGTGILGLLACRAGAGRVYAIEEDVIAGLAASIARRNGCGARIVPIRGHSSRVSLPERADLLVCDQIGRFGLEAGLLDLAADARARFLRPGAAIVPARVDLIAAPIESARLHARVTYWTRRPAGFDFAPAFEVARNSGYPVRLGGRDLLTAPAILTSVDLAAETGVPIVAGATFRPARAGTVHGIGGWFDARLSPSVTMTNSPLSPSRIDRRQVFFPIADPVAVTPRDTIDLTFRILPADHVYVWDVTVTAGGSAPIRSRHTTLRGMLLSREDVRLTSPESRPRLNAHGRARLAILELCDGQRTLRAIELDVRNRFPDLFASAADAEAFVAEVVTRYALPAV
jgi:protein arginine N-methyltransferase 1